MVGVGGSPVAYPTDGLKTFNRGISGPQGIPVGRALAGGLPRPEPNPPSILIGVNDFWHTLDPKLGYKGTAEIYERDYEGAAPADEAVPAESEAGHLRAIRPAVRRGHRPAGSRELTGFAPRPSVSRRVSM